MDFEWTPHRFAGGLLILDLCNTVILRHDAARRADRLAVPDQLAAFPGAVARFCAETGAAGTGIVVRDARRLLGLRESADRHFRACAEAEPIGETLPALLEHVAGALRAGPFEQAAATSALRLAADPLPGRLKRCPACGWLFADRSKNRSRAWCDMAVCGNRAKARRHHREGRPA